MRREQGIPRDGRGYVRRKQSLAGSQIGAGDGTLVRSLRPACSSLARRGGRQPRGLSLSVASVGLPYAAYGHEPSPRAQRANAQRGRRPERVPARSRPGRHRDNVQTPLAGLALCALPDVPVRDADRRRCGWDFDALLARPVWIRGDGRPAADPGEPWWEHLRRCSAGDVGGDGDPELGLPARLCVEQLPGCLGVFELAGDAAQVERRVSLPGPLSAARSAGE